jgi:DNA-binding CsgD family transcriptional regulator
MTDDSDGTAIGGNGGVKLSETGARKLEAEIASAASPQELRRVAVPAITAFRMRSANYHYLPPFGGHEGDRVRAYSSTHSVATLARYLKSGMFRSNPFVAQSLRETEPFTRIDPALIDPANDPVARAIYDEIVATHPHGWVGVPVYGPGGRDGTFLLGCSEANADMRGCDAVEIARLQSVCQAVHLKFCAMVASSLDPPPRLTRRELDVLGWVARGKSNSDIAGILHISPHGVDAHLRSIYSKLGVFDRLSATLRGLGFGILFSTRV